MAKILLISSNSSIFEKVAQAVRQTGHELLRPKDVALADSMKEAAESIAGSKPDLVIMDFWAEDAASVKLMQSVGEPGPSFIFIQKGEAPLLSEALLALNEGAEAFLTENFRPQALMNYIERAVKGPGRLRWQNRCEADTCDQTLEVALGALRIKNSRLEKLIAHLLSTPASSLKRKTLVVSDSPFQRDFLKKILEEHNFPTIVAPDFEEGQSQALSESPRIIVSDLELGEKTGLELCRAVKLEHKLIPCYFVICTADKRRIESVMTPGNGVDDCIMKPSGPSDEADFVSRVALGLLL